MTLAKLGKTMRDDRDERLREWVRNEDGRRHGLDIAALLAECGQLREQLDAARQALELIARLDEQSEAYHPDDVALRIARAALGVER